MSTPSTLPAEGFFRISHIVGDSERGIEPIIPVSRSTWWAGVKSGRFPQPIRFGGITMWRKSDIQALVESINSDIIAA